MPRPSNKTERRQQIVEGLMSIMATSGYSGATIALIAKASGLTTGLVHYHFDSKQSILIELVRYLVALVDARFQSYKKQDPLSKMTAYIDAHLALGSESNSTAVACWISIGAEAVNQTEVRLAYQEATEHQVSVLESLCEEVLISSGRDTVKKREIALGILAAIEGCYRLLISAPDMIPRGFAAPTVNSMAQGMIAAQPKVPSKPPSKRRT